MPRSVNVSSKNFSHIIFDNETPSGISELILNRMHALFPYQKDLCPRTCSKTELPLQIYKELSGSDSMRINRAPRGPAQERNIIRIAETIKSSKPISIITFIGTAKFPDGTPEQNVADLADFGALHTLIALDQRVRQVYPPGIVARLYYEDVVGDWLFGTHSRPIQDNYRESLKELHKNVKRQFGNPTYLVSERSIMRKLGLDDKEFFRRAAKIEPLFLEYILASESVMTDFIARTPYTTWLEAKKTLGNAYADFWREFAEQHIEKMECYKALAAEGWRGLIPPEMREFYFQRFAGNVNSTTIHNRQGFIKYMAHYYSSSLLKTRLRSAYTSMPVDSKKGFDASQALKLSFAGFPPGIPERHQEVFQMRAILNHKKRGGVDNCSAPWRGVGGLLLREDGSVRANMTPSRSYVDTNHIPAWIHFIGGGSLYAPLMIRGLRTTRS